MIWKLWVICMAISGISTALAVAAVLIFMANSDNKNETWWKKEAREKELSALFFWSGCVAITFGVAAWVIWP